MTTGYYIYSIVLGTTVLPFLPVIPVVPDIPALLHAFPYYSWLFFNRPLFQAESCVLQ